MSRKISAYYTFPMKFVVPVGWFIGLGVLSYLLTFHPASLSSFRGSRGGPTSIDRIFFPAMWLVGNVYFFWNARLLKCVFIDTHGLRVSNYREEIFIPFEEIATVTQNLWVNSRDISITFRNDTPFGRKIKFFPNEVKFFAFPRESEVVAELRNYARSSRR